MSNVLGVPVPEQRNSSKAAVATVVAVVVLAVCLTWAFLAMRAVMDVGGSCASGNSPYQIQTECPDGSWLISLAIPVMLITTFIGTATASVVGAPNLIVPMWGVLFGSLGWNFLEYAFKFDGVVWGWLICGVMFWAMALPAIWFMAIQLRPLVAKSRTSKAWMWTPAYGVLGAVGLAFGWWSYVAIAG